MATSYPIRPVSAAELPAFLAVASQAFNTTWPDEDVRTLWQPVFEAARSLVAFDGELMVGTAVICTFSLTVPGGAVDVAGVSGVAVLPSHRRRGILSSLMRRQLNDIVERGEPVAALFASESGIYGRYGYGAASEHLSFTIRRGEGSLLPAAATGQGDRAGSDLSLRIAEPTAAVRELAAVYDAVRAVRPGMVTRNGIWWDAVLADPPFQREGNCPQRCLLAEDSSGPRGYALYAVKPHWADDSIPAQLLTVGELFGTDPTATAALWADLLTRDLVGEVCAESRPVDDPLPHLLADRRRVRARVADGLWIRLADLPVALTQRRYSGPVDVVIEVTDQLLPANSGRWRLQAGGLADAAPPVCERTSAAADVALPVAALGAAYLGGTRLRSLADAGLVAEFRPGSLAPLSAAMWWDPAPWSPMTF